MKNHLAKIFVLIGIVFFFIYTYIWNEWDFLPISIDKSFISFWASLLTICGLLLAIYRQFGIENKLRVHNHAVVQSNVKICIHLLEDTISLLNSPNTDFRSVALIRERILIHLSYCKKCCPEEEEGRFEDNIKKLSNWEMELRGKIKGQKRKFDEAKFSQFLRDLKSFLMTEDQFSFKI